MNNHEVHKNHRPSTLGTIKTVNFGLAIGAILGVCSALVIL